MTMTVDGTPEVSIRQRRPTAPANQGKTKTHSSRLAPDQAAKRNERQWALIVRSQNGDTQAYGELYGAYRASVFRYICGRVPNRSIAEDLTSEVFERGLKRINQFQWQGRDIGAWFMTIAKNLVFDHFKAGRTRHEIPVSSHEHDDPDSDPSIDPERRAINSITNRILLETLMELHEAQRECLIARFLKGYSVAETAEELNNSEGGIKALQYRAVSNMRKLLPPGFMESLIS